MKNILGFALAFLLAATPLYAQVIQGGGGSGSGSSSTFVSTNAMQFAGNPLAIGQSLMVSAIPVVVASDQTPIVPKQYTGTTITRPANSTAYVAGQLFYSATTSGLVDGATIQITRTAGVTSTLYNMSIVFSSIATTNKIVRVHLYNQQPTFTSGDGGNWLTSKAGYQGCFDITVDKVFSDGSYGRGVPCNGSVIVAAPVSGQNYDYYAIEMRGAYTPSSGETAVPSIEVP